MTKKYWQDWVIMLLGAWAFVSPWVLAHAGTGGTEAAHLAALATWNLWIVGAVVAALALSARSKFAPWKEWINAALGISLCVSPWFWTTERTVVLTWSTIISGFVIMMFAAWSAGDAYDLLPKRVLRKGDMRTGLPELALPDEFEHLAGLQPHTDTGPGIVAPDQHVQAPGNVVKG